MIYHLICVVSEVKEHICRYGGMLALDACLIRLNVGRGFGKTMGPGRYSLRAAARSCALTAALKETSGVVTPRVSSNISRAKLKQIGSLRVEIEAGGESDGSFEDKVASEEFNNRGFPKVDGIKRKLNFDLKAGSINGIKQEPTISASYRARKVRKEVKSEIVDDSIAEARLDAGLRRRSLQNRITRLKEKIGGKEGNEIVKQEDAEGGGFLRRNLQRKVSALESEEGQGAGQTGMNDVVKPEPREEAGLRRRKLARAIFIKVKKEQEEEVERRVDNIVKQGGRHSHREVPGADFKKEEGGEDLLKPEPHEKSRTRRRQLAHTAAVRVAQVQKVDKSEELDKHIDEFVKQAQVFAVGPKRKPLKKVSARDSSITGAEVSEDERRTSVAKCTPPLLELIPVSSFGGAKLAAKEESAIITLPGPYPGFARPFPNECQQAKDLLSSLHGHLPEYERHRKSCPTIEGPTDHSISLGSSSAEPRKRGRPRAELKEMENAGTVQLALTVRASSTDNDRSKITVPTGHPRERGSVLDSLVGTLLSQNTTDNSSRKAFAALKSAFPTWQDVQKAEPQAVEDAIRCCGLAEIKATRIRTILDTLLKERGEVSMEYVRSMSNEEIKLELSRFKGVGPKTVACVLMFHLQRNEFPVDTHVFRISKMLGWVPAQADREKAYLHLNQQISDSLKFDIHCLFVMHGKRCPQCAKRSTQKPADGPCPLLNWKTKWAKITHSVPASRMDDSL